MMEKLIQEIREFAGKRDWQQFHTPKNLAMALSVEASEIVEIFQWLTGEQSRKLSPERVADLEEEIGDVMIYLTCLADKFDMNPLEAARKKMLINEKRYPVHLSRGSAKKYDELTEIKK